MNPAVGVTTWEANPSWLRFLIVEHHDGFALWDSKVNEWNSASKGPLLNLAKLHVDAFRNQGLKIMAAFHHGASTVGGATGSASQVGSPSSGCVCNIQVRAKSTANSLLFLGIVVAGCICRRRSVPRARRNHGGGSQARLQPTAPPR